MGQGTVGEISLRRKNSWEVISYPMGKNKIITILFMEEIEAAREAKGAMSRSAVARAAFAGESDPPRKYRLLRNGSQILDIEEAYKLALVVDDSADQVLFRALSKKGADVPTAPGKVL